MKKSTKVVLIVATLIVALTIGPYLLMFAYKKITVFTFDKDYRDLARQCEQRNGFGCCISSVSAMEKGNYKLSDNGKCGDGFSPNAMLCFDSFGWCEPIRKQF